MKPLHERFVIEKVEDTEQDGQPLWRLTSTQSGSICIDAVGRRPEVGDTMVQHFADASRNWVSHTVVIPAASASRSPVSEGSRS